MKTPSQTTRLLRMLEVAGAGGITQLDMMRPLDGGAPIMALSQRIGDLTRSGHTVESRRERTPAGANIARYSLTGDRMRGTVPRTPPETSCKTTTAQPEDTDLVHSSTTHPGSRV